MQEVDFPTPESPTIATDSRSDLDVEPAEDLENPLRSGIA